MIAEHLEPKGLTPNARPIGDFMRAGDHRANAVAGSTKLLKAILRAAQTSTPRKPKEFRPRTWAERKKAKAKVLRIRCEVAEYFGHSVADMLSRRGVESLCRHRQIAMFLARTTTSASYADIGQYFGGRDHTTIIHACEQIADALKYDLRIKRDVAFLRDAVLAG